MSFQKQGLVCMYGMLIHVLISRFPEIRTALNSKTVNDNDNNEWIYSPYKIFIVDEPIS